MQTGPGGTKPAKRKREWGRARRGECDNCWMRTECVRLATLPLGRPRLVHLSLSVFVARRSLSESDAPVFIRQGSTAAKRRRAHWLSHVYCTGSHTHTHSSHTRWAGRQHDFILQSGFSARYDGGEPPACSRRQNVSWISFLLSLFVSACTVLKRCCPMWKCCSVSGHVTRMEVRLYAVVCV